MHGQIARQGSLRDPLRKRDSHLWARHPEDWYVEPAWVSERLFEVERFEGAVWDPSCGMGRIAQAALRATPYVQATDLVDRGYEHFAGRWDFTATPRETRDAGR